MDPFRSIPSSIAPFVSRMLVPKAATTPGGAPRPAWCEDVMRNGVSVDKGHAVLLSEEPGNGRLATGDAPSQADDPHMGQEICGGWSLGPVEQQTTRLGDEVVGGRAMDRA